MLPNMEALGSTNGRDPFSIRALGSLNDSKPEISFAYVTIARKLIHYCRLRYSVRLLHALQHVQGS
jgi:hypothetical protein